MTRRLVLLAPILLAGCAKFPDTGVAVNDTRMIFRMTVAGTLRSDYVYIVAINASNDLNPTTVGPQPIVTYPSSNGFVAGGVTHFVRWDPLQSRAYLLYRFTDPNLVSFREVAIPITSVDVGAGGRTLQFELSTLQLADTPALAAQLQSLQVNFLTRNRVSLASGQGTVFDALGDTRLASEVNQYIRIPLVTSGVYDNSRFNLLEPSGDTPDPDLDITDFSVEVRRQ